MNKKLIFIVGGSVTVAAAVTCCMLAINKIYNKPVINNNVAKLVETANISEDVDEPSSSDSNISEESVDETTDITSGSSDSASSNDDKSSKDDKNKDNKDKDSKDKSVNSSKTKTKTNKEKAVEEAKESTINDFLSDEQKALLNDYLAKLKAAELLKKATQVANSQTVNSSSSDSSSSSSSSNSDKKRNSSKPTYVRPSKENTYNKKTAATNGKAYSFEKLGDGNLTGIPFNYNSAKSLYDKNNTGLIPARNGEVSSKKKFTVLLYICGTDLESKRNEDGTYKSDGSASSDIFDLIKSNFDLEKVNVLVCAGGTNHWASPYMNGTYATNTIDTDGDGVFDSKVNNDSLRCNIYVVDPTKFGQVRNSDNKDDFKTIFAEELPCLASFDAGNASNIGNAQLLSGFLDFAAEYFPAENYGLFLNNHGGGVNGGICFPDSIDGVAPAGKSLKAYDIEAALRSSKEFGVNSDNRLSFLAMDACMMGSSELAYNMAPYTNYYIGASEIEAGSFNYTDVMSYINAEVKNDTINHKQIASGIVESYFNAENHKGDGDIIGDLMCFDSNAVYEFGKQVDNFAAEIVGLKGNSQYSNLWNICLQTIESASYHVDSMGTQETAEGGNYEGYFDTLGLLKYIKENLSLCSSSLNALEKEKVKAINSIIDKALNTKFLVAGGVYYGKEEVFQCRTDVKSDELLSLNDIDKLGIWSKPVSETIDSKWTKFKGSENGGTSLFVPVVFGAKLNDETDAWNNWDSAKNKAKTYTDMSILTNYSKLINEYIDYEYSDEMMNKRRELVANIDYTQAIMSVKASDNQSSDNAPQVLLQRFYKNGEGKDSNTQYVDYVQVKFNEEPTSSTTYTYDDVVKTVEKLKLYVDRTQTVRDTATNTDKDIQIIVGSVDVPLTSLSGAQSALNIKADTLAKAMAYKVFGLAENKINSMEYSSNNNDNTWIVDWATRVDRGDTYASTIQFEGYAYQFNDSEDAFIREDTESNPEVYPYLERVPTPITITFEACGSDDSISYRFKEAKYNDDSLNVDTINYYSFAHHYFEKYTDEKGNSNYYSFDLEMNDGLGFNAPIFKAAQDNKVLISIFSSNVLDSNNSYSLEFTKADDKTQVVYLPTEDEEKKSSSYAELDSLADPIWGTTSEQSASLFADKAPSTQDPRSAEADPSKLLKTANSNTDNGNAENTTTNVENKEKKDNEAPKSPEQQAEALAAAPVAAPEVQAALDAAALAAQNQDTQVEVVTPQLQDGVVIPEVPAEAVIPEAAVPAEVVTPELPEVPAVQGVQEIPEEAQAKPEITLTLVEPVVDDSTPETPATSQEIIVNAIENVIALVTTPSDNSEDKGSNEDSSKDDGNSEDSGSSSEVIFIDTTDHNDETATDSVPDDIAA